MTNLEICAELRRLAATPGVSAGAQLALIKAYFAVLEIDYPEEAARLKRKCAMQHGAEMASLGLLVEPKEDPEP